ncbi:hypothetical protein [Mycolicibacterium phocaicum]|uniref:hypothetical protein n=1 Tax=Mycolicibacterium phocaicum TaxID=319706 RepID=UPI001CFAE3C7|nr:hypothetical protein [Mycolicibacterium phocaicum]UCZ61456.1 hypothetical protein LHJ73_04290 [Mycolicibacterium phocaicum]
MADEVEPDARIRAERASDAINFYDAHAAYRDGIEPPRVQGMAYAMTADHDVRVRTLSQLVVDRHRHCPSERLWIEDDQKASDGTPLPPWNISDPSQGNVIRGLVASQPHTVHVLRGSYTPTELARRIWDGEIQTHCNVNVCADCDITAAPPRGWTDRSVWGIFTDSIGEYLVYLTICGPCFFRLWPMDDGVSFYTFDPKHETAEDLNHKRAVRQR